MQQHFVNLGMIIHKTSYNDSGMVNDSAIKYQNVLIDNLDESINITFSTPSPLNSLVTKCNTSFTTNDSYVKKYCQTAFDQLKSHILTEVTQEIKKM